MGTNRSSIGRAGHIVLAAALSLTALASAKAFEVTAEQRAACTPDAFRLCSSEIPDVQRIVACMKAKEASLSAPCRAVFETASLSRALPSHQRIAHRTYSTYASYRAVPSAPPGGRHSRQAFQAWHGHEILRIGLTYASYGAPSSSSGQWTPSRDDREALIIGRKVLIGYAMACRNHSIPDELCDFSVDSLGSPNINHESSGGSGYQSVSGSVPSTESSPTSEDSAEHETRVAPTNFHELGSLFSAFVQ
jgi:hypothetical protein